MKTEENKPNNPRMSPYDGMYASEARAEDYFSLRDHFAGLASMSIINTIGHIDGSSDCEFVAEYSYKLADAMLKQRML